MMMDFVFWITLAFLLYKVIVTAPTYSWCDLKKHEFWKKVGVSLSWIVLAFVYLIVYLRWKR